MTKAEKQYLILEKRILKYDRSTHLVLIDSLSVIGKEKRQEPLAEYYILLHCPFTFNQNDWNNILFERTEHCITDYVFK
jgi:hypothetical protein